MSHILHVLLFVFFVSLFYAMLDAIIGVRYCGDLIPAGALLFASL